MQFLLQAKQERTALIHTLRECAFIIMQSIDVSSTLWITNNGGMRKESPVLRGLLHSPNRSAANDPLSPILYPNAQRDSRYLFMNEIQPKVGTSRTRVRPYSYFRHQIIRSILFNKSSLTAEKFNFSQGLLGMMWGVKSVNDSCIALSAILVSRY